MERVIRDAGFIPFQRNNRYQPVPPRALAVAGGQ